MEVLYKNKDWLKHQYLTLNLSQREIAEKFGVNRGSIYWFVKKFELKKPHIVESKIGRLLKWKVAYLAASIDCDGCIHVPKTKGSGVSMEVTNTDLFFLQSLQEMIGGGIVFQYTTTGPSHYKPCYWLFFCVNECRELLPQLIPFLVIKKEKAKILLKRLREVSDESF